MVGGAPGGRRGVVSGYLLGADVGTSALKAALVHPERGVVAVAERPYPLHRPHPGWAENDPEDWYAALAAAVPEVLARARVGAAQVDALCLVGQRDVAVLLDEAGRVLTPCIHWTDRRAPDETERLFAELGERLVAVSGVLPIPGLVLPNLAWTRRHRPEVWRAARHALQPKDFLAHRLTGDVATDTGSPTRSLLNDWRTWDWSPELCTAAGIELELLPPVRYRSWEVRGQLGAAAASALGLAPGTVLAAGGGDDQSATFGVGVVEPGELSIGAGSSTSWRLVDAEATADPAGLIGVAPHVVPDRVIGEMVAVGTGTSFRWFRDAFGAGATYEELIAEAATVEPGAGGLLAFPYPEGATLPEQDARVRAAFLGIDAAHRRPHFARAILEAIAYLYPALLALVEQRGHAVEAITLSDGEARSETWNRIKADVLGRPLTPALVAEAPAVGAAMLAGLATGAFADAPSAVAAVVVRGAAVEPSTERHERYRELRAAWEQARRHVFAVGASPPAPA